MNHPTREEFEHLKDEQRQLKEEVRKLKEQVTEPIRITRLEIDSRSMQDSIEKVNKRLDTVQEDTNILKIEMQGARTDILQIRESQADLRDRLIEHSEDLKAIKEKQDAHSELFEQLINIGENHTQRFDRLETSMATKDDISRIETSMATKDDISRIEKIMMQLLNRMPKTEGE